MARLGASGLLDLWERGRALDPVRQALLLLREAWPEFDPEGWACLPVGARDAWLVALREHLFGTRFETLADCPACGTALDTGFSASDLPVSPPDPPSPGELARDGYRLSYRLPTSADLIALLGEQDAGEVDAGEAGRRLLAHCVEAASRDDQAVSLDALPSDLLADLEREMAERDPAADIRVGLICQACNHEFSRRFDILDHLWGELEDCAGRLLAEVHVLAGAYGWSEDAILALSPSRRQHYIALVAP
jgi:hypothetical protein